MDIAQSVAQIIAEVRQRGDHALCAFAQRFDHVRLVPRQLRVSAGELQQARQRVSPEVVKSLQECARRIESFARKEKSFLRNSWTLAQKGSLVGQVTRPMDSAGLYIPGGRFPYPSTVLMTGIPARIAGVKRIIIATPPGNLTPEVLTAASIAGVQEIYRMGGAGAIAAMAYGTGAIRKVDFIVGPGNQYVTEAKRQVYGQVGIDSLAGPSEVVVIADRSAPADYIAADLMAQAEHDPDARSHLLILDSALLKAVRQRLDTRIKNRVILEKVKSVSAAIERANAIAPEHLELLIQGAQRYLPQIRHAGAIFIGVASPAAMGDYVAGPSHVLPTRGAARFSSGLSVATFLKRSSIIGFSGGRLELPQWKAALQMAQTEGMENHAKSLRLRLTAKS